MRGRFSLWVDRKKDGEFVFDSYHDTRLKAETVAKMDKYVVLNRCDYKVIEEHPKPTVRLGR